VSMRGSNVMGGPLSAVTGICARDEGMMEYRTDGKARFPREADATYD
jgi:hypothetical protein